MLLLKKPGRLLVLIDPGWQSRILPADREFFEEIIADFAHRAESDALGLLKQASELNLGPLITLETGFLAADRGGIADLVLRYIPI